MNPELRGRKPSRSRLFSLVTGMVFVLLATTRAGDISATRAPRRQQDGLPGWARTREDPEYPQDRYLLGLGVAALESTPTEALEEAAARSRADIAKQIRSHVEQELRDSLREDRLVGGVSFSRITGRLTVRTEESTAIDLEGVEIVRQWIGSRSVFVLSALDRERAAARAWEWIERLKVKISDEMDEVASLLEDEPLEAMARLESLRFSADALAMQYEILSGVSGTLHVPPVWLDRLDGLASRVHGSVHAAITVRETHDGHPPHVPTTYAGIEAFLVDLGWTVRKLETRPRGSPRPPDEVASELAREGIRYLIEVNAEAKNTDSVRVGSSSMYFARAGGSLVLLDLVDDDVLFRVDYPFPSETKTGHGDSRSARRIATDRLFDLMLADLMSYLGPSR